MVEKNIGSYYNRYIGCTVTDMVSGMSKIRAQLDTIDRFSFHFGCGWWPLFF